VPQRLDTNVRPHFFTIHATVIRVVVRLASKDEQRHDMTEQQRSQRNAGNRSVETPDVWRNEVQDRLARYKRRRGRRIEGAYTMRFPFPSDDALSASVPTTDADQQAEAAGHVQPAKTTAVLPGAHDEQADTVDRALTVERVTQPVAVVDLVLEAPPTVEEEPAPFVDLLPRPRPKRKVIAFPKHPSASTHLVHWLADPVLAEAPRILDVPEELEAIPATPFLDGLQLDVPARAVVEHTREHSALPHEPVRISQRVLAAMVDLAIIGIGVAIFAVVAYRVLQSPPVSKPLVLGVGAAVAVLWTAYQYLFVVHAGKTLGMMAARVSLRTFKGKAPNMQQRRLRVLGFYLSTLSLGMGLMWAFVDTDGLCWHDRLSQTFLQTRH